MARWAIYAGSMIAALALGALGLAGCESTPTDPDAGRPRDAGPMRDAQTIDAPIEMIDAGLDAGMIDAGPRTCVGSDGVTEGSDVLEDALGRASVSIEGDRDACARTYLLGSTAARRESFPTSPRRVTEREGAPTLRTGHDLFDALFALALAEAAEGSVASISDGAFDMGRPFVCPEGGCFETGRLWTYVWTRDTSYSVDLGLAALDPTRALNSMLFKLSERRGGGGVQIVQDTGSGGSYPVSSDRVVWALGAEALLAELDGAAREGLRDRAYEALAHTLAHDREVVFDVERGLYRGETSFLDWREQSYAGFTAEDTATIAESESLSTNVLHLRALELASRLAGERGDDAARDRLASEATALRSRIAEVFWDESTGELSAFTPIAFDRAPVRRRDLLGTSLAILSGVIDDADGRRALSAYPHFERGAPVIAPQQQYVAIYHNRAQWPFVTAYELLAARRARHAGAATHATRTLVRGAALALSNMESFEVPTGRPYVDEGATSGPVVNSHRQLWSVAGYLAMVARGMFGIDAQPEGLVIAPYVTADLARELFADRRELVLNEWPVRGRTVSVVLHLPESLAEAGRDYDVTSVRLNGVPVTGAIPYGWLEAQNRVDVELTASTRAGDAVRLVDPSDWRNVFGPRTPVASLDVEGGRLRVRFDLAGETAADVRVSVIRDGARIADGLTEASYLDASWDASSARTPCYAIETCFANGNCSQRSAPVCYWGAGGARVRTVGAAGFVATGGTLVTEHGYAHYQAWGDTGHRLEVRGVRPVQTGPFLLQVLYGNGAGPINTGITCAVKRVIVEDEASGEIVGTGLLVMPQLGRWDRWASSTVVPVELDASRSYRISITSDDTTINMSSLQHFARYTAGSGGSAPFERVNIAELRLLAR